jgi:hypothetical protein
VHSCRIQICQVHYTGCLQDIPDGRYSGRVSGCFMKKFCPISRIWAHTGHQPAGTCHHGYLSAGPLGNCYQDTELKKWLCFYCLKIEIHSSRHIFQNSLIHLQLAAFCHLHRCGYQESEVFREVPAPAAGTWVLSDFFNFVGGDVGRSHSIWTQNDSLTQGCASFSCTWSSCQWQQWWEWPAWKCQSCWEAADHWDRVKGGQVKDWSLFLCWSAWTVDWFSTW